MANDNNIKFTAEDIERYHKGSMSSKERHALEKAALDDPFLADALEGYAVAGVDVTSDMADLRNRLSTRQNEGRIVVMQDRKRSGPSLLRIAAMIVVALGAAFLTYQLGFNNNSPKEDIAQNSPAVEKKDAVITGADSSKYLDTQASKDSGPSLTSSRPGTNQAAEGQSAGSDAKKNEYRPVEKETDNDKAKALTPVTEIENKAVLNETTTAPAAVAKNQNAAKKEKAEADKDGVSDLYSNTNREVVADNSRRDVNYSNVQKRSNTPNNSNNQQFRGNVFRGLVVDENNNPVPFANVTNVVDNVGTYTDARGNFNLVSSDTTLNVQVRSLGFNSNNIALRNSVPTNQVVLQEDKLVTEEVISNKKPNARSRAVDANMKLEDKSEPEDGWEKYDYYLVNNLNIPDEFKTKQSGGGEVKVSFEVNKLGEPMNFRIEKSLCTKCDEEAIRLIKEGPKWKRKVRKGRTSVTITF